jgi:secreted trypsin-like serine protease
LTIVAGLYYQSKPNPQRVQRYNYEKITNHPQYSGSTHENDVAVIRLATPATLNSYVNIACLPGKDPVLDESVMIGMSNNSIKTLLTFIFELNYLAGWGTTKFEGSSPDALNQAKVEIMDYCKYIYGSYDDKKQICAGNKLYTKDSCQGDSGGPLVYQVNGQWIISGVVSYGDGCAKINRPGVYARVSYYLGWIRSVTGSASGK